MISIYPSPSGADRGADMVKEKSMQLPWLRFTRDTRKCSITMRCVLRGILNTRMILFGVFIVFHILVFMSSKILRTMYVLDIKIEEN